MKKLLLMAVLMAVMPVVWAQTSSKANPGSLYQNGAANPWLDQVARKEGDVLMIVINESSAANFAAATNATKSDGNSVSQDVLKGFFGQLFGPFMTTANGKTAGSGDTTHRSSMTTRMSVVVKQVLPNGLLLIEGTRTLVTNKETQTFVLSGLVRTTDVQSDNTVDSSRIAEAEIKLQATGMVADRQRKGILTQLLDWLF